MDGGTEKLQSAQFVYLTGWTHWTKARQDYLCNKDLIRDWGGFFLRKFFIIFHIVTEQRKVCQ